MCHNNLTLAATVFLAFLAWVGVWGLCQLFAAAAEQSGALSLYAFTIGFSALAGVLVPLAIIARNRLSLSGRSGNRDMVAGAAAFALALGLGLFGSGAAIEIGSAPPSLAVILKYLLLFAPMALAVSLFAFFLVPATCRRLLGDRWPTGLVSTVLSALVLGIGFWADQRFATADLALIQAILGLIIGAGVWLTRSFGAATVTYFVILLANTLAEAKYHSLPWSPIVWGFILATAIVALFSLAQTHNAGARAQE